MTAFTQTPTDSAGLKDSGLIGLVLPADSPGPTDSLSFAYSPVENDSAGLTDGIAFALSPVDTDGAGLTDSLAFSVSPVVADGSGLTDSRVFSVAPVIADNSGLTDSTAYANGKSQAPTDVAGVTDGIVFSLSPVLTDAAGNVDTSSAIRGISSSVTDGAGATDTGAVVSLAGLTNDSVGLISNHALVQSKVFSDVAGTTDSGTVIGQFGTIADDSGLTDVFSVSRGSAQIFTDASGLVDSSPLLEHTYSQGQSDTAGPTDTGTSLAITGIATDSTGLSDLPSVFYRAGGQFPQDTAGVTDLTSKAFYDDVQDDDVGLTDLPTFSLSVTYADAAGMSDPNQVNRIRTVGPTDPGLSSDATVLDRGLTVTDAAGMTDTQAYSVGGAQGDVLGLTDALSRQFGENPVDGAGLSDSAIANRIISRTFSDLTEVSESDSFLIGGTFLINEGPMLSDSISMNRSVTFNDALANVDSISYEERFTDSLSLTDNWFKSVSRILPFDSVGLKDEGLPTGSRVYLDTETLSDVAKLTQSKSPLDVTGLSDNYTVIHLLPLTFQDLIRPLDSKTPVQDLAKVIVDGLSLQDSVHVDHIPEVDDDSGLTDLVNLRLVDSRLTGRWSFT